MTSGWKSGLDSTVMGFGRKGRAPDACTASRRHGCKVRQIKAHLPRSGKDGMRECAEYALMKDTPGDAGGEPGMSPCTTGMIIASGPLRFDSAVLCFDNGALRFDNAALCFDSVALRFDNGALRFGNGVLRFDNGVLRFDNGVLRFDNGPLSFGDGALSFACAVQSLAWSAPALVAGARFSGNLMCPGPHRMYPGSRRMCPGLAAGGFPSGTQPDAVKSGSALCSVPDITSTWRMVFSSRPIPGTGAL